MSAIEKRFGTMTYTLAPVVFRTHLENFCRVSEQASEKFER